MSQYNADCILKEPRSVPDASDSLQSKHLFTEHEQQRCSLTPDRTELKPTEAGVLTLSKWTCRLFSDAAIKAGWRVKALLDGGSEWAEYEVMAADPSRLQRKQWALKVQAVS